MMKIHYILMLLVSRVRSQEVTTPSSQLRPRNHNHHPFDVEQFLKNLKAAPTKQGPVLFPNDAPPPPRPPLIVTSRPLFESIARSELGNNTEASSSQIDRVSFLPYLARVNSYTPYIPVPSPTYSYNLQPTSVPYADIVKKSRQYALERDNRYDDYEEQTVLPPIYKALSDHAKQNVLKLKENHYKDLDYNQNYENNDITDENFEKDQNQNYAFSYRVKDQKTGDDFSHSQHSSGSATNGEYRVRLPDGRMQIVSYTADENGYKADVRYDEEKNRIDTNNHDYSNDYVERKVSDDKYKNVYVEENNLYDKNIYELKNNDYTDRNIKTDYNNNKKPNDDYYSDLSKEYDYSSEYNYQPHKSKYSTFYENKNTASTVKPSYEELKPLFVKRVYSTTQNYNSIDRILPTVDPLDETTERVVVIGTKSPNLYTNIRGSIPNIPNYPSPRVVVATTPKSYLVSTIASLKNKVHFASKPVLSDNYINKIHKYLSFN